MNNKLNIPEKIKVGFQTRQDTYTGKLAYVIYVDNKGKLRKEKSWQSWRSDKIDPEDFTNEPIEGFVLNKGVGGARASYGWNARNEYIRVYDPRNFEFEISVANLLFILQECSAIKGKGLEGEFVYSWQGTELVLLPTCSQEYIESTKFNAIQTKKVTAKDMEVGCSYLTKDQVEVMYLGRHPWFEKTYMRKRVDSTSGYRGYWKSWQEMKAKKSHIFIPLDQIGVEVDSSKINNRGKHKYWIQSGFTKLAAKTSDNALDSYAEEFERLANTGLTSAPVKLITRPTKVNILDSSGRCYSQRVCIKRGEKLTIGCLSSMSSGYMYNNRSKQGDQVAYKYRIHGQSEVMISNGEYIEKSASLDIIENATLDEINAMTHNIFVLCENGKEYSVDTL